MDVAAIGRRRSVASLRTCRTIANSVSTIGSPIATSGTRHGDRRQLLNELPAIEVVGEDVAEEQAARVAHEDAGRVEVEEQEAEHRAAEGRAHQRDQASWFSQPTTKFVTHAKNATPPARPSSRRSA